MYDTMMPMRRAQAILVVVALLAIPLAMLARSGPCEQTQCMCCLMHGSKAQHGKAMQCSHCSGQKKCGIGSQLPDYGLIAPMAPTTPAPQTALAALAVSRRVLVNYAPGLPTGFSSEPFEPPRG